MLKIYFNTIVPYPQRNKLIHAFKDLGFKFDRILSNGQYSTIRFRGRLPTLNNSNLIDIYYSDENIKNEFKNINAEITELFFYCERKKDYENKC